MKPAVSLLFQFLSACQLLLQLETDLLIVQLELPTHSYVKNVTKIYYMKMVRIMEPTVRCGG